MSSSVSYAYTVRQEALRREREERAARDAFQGACRRHERLRQEALSLRRVWGDAIEVPAEAEAVAEADGASAWRALHSALEERTEVERRQLAKQVSAARVAVIEAGMARLGAPGSEPVDAATALAQRRAEVTSAEGGRDAEAGAGEGIEQAIARLAGRLDVDAPATEVTAVERAAAAAREAGDATAREQALDALRAQVQAANAAAEAFRERVAELDRLEASLDGCLGPEAGAARELLTALRRRPDPLPPGLTAMVDAALAEGERHARADYVAARLGEALADLGYELGPEFSTTLASSGWALASKADWRGYGVAVSCSGDPAQLGFDVVRGEASRADQAARDLEVEREFCAARPALLERLAQAGIDASQTLLVEEGSVALRVEPALSEPVGGEQEAQRAREMEL